MVALDFACRTRYVNDTRRGTQVVRERSAKPLCAGSIPARASSFASPTSRPLRYLGSFAASRTLHFQ